MGGEVPALTAPLEARRLAFSSWGEAREFANRLGRFFVFRGQSNAEWNLSTSFERAADARGLPSAGWPAHEAEMLARFTERLHHYELHVPADGELIDWLSTMQHHGTPTRLLDVTRSFYIAAFFAFESPGTGGTVAIWGFSRVLQVLGQKLAKLRYAQAAAELFESWTSQADQAPRVAPFEAGDPRCFFPPWGGGAEAGVGPIGGLVHTRPRRANPRLAQQQGEFLFPTDGTRSFESNLAEALGTGPRLALPEVPEEFDPTKDYFSEVMQTGVYKLELPGSERAAALADLRAMNVDASTLFPGLEGFSRSIVGILDGEVEGADRLRDEVIARALATTQSS